MNRIAEWIRRHQFASFIIMCYVLFWAATLPVLLLRIDLLEILFAFGLFTPAISCILISRICEPDRIPTNRKVRWGVFLGVWVGAIAILILYNRPGEEAAMPAPFAVFLVYYAVFALFPAWIISSGFSGTAGVRKSLSSLVRPTGAWGWYVLAMLLPPVTRWLGVLISNGMGWELLTEPARLTGFELVSTAIISYLYTVVFAGGLNEEAGWTAFGLPRLQARHSPLIASMILWFFWLAWHIPAHLGGYWTATPQILIATFIARFVFTWLYNRSKGGLLTAIFFHTSANVASEFIPVSYGVLVVEGIVAIILIVAGRMWEKLPADSPAVYLPTGVVPQETLQGERPGGRGKRVAEKGA